MAIVKLFAFHANAIIANNLLIITYSDDVGDPYLSGK